jgi:hypothetical protein
VSTASYLPCRSVKRDPHSATSLLPLQKAAFDSSNCIVTRQTMENVGVINHFISDCP